MKKESRLIANLQGSLALAGAGNWVISASNPAEAQTGQVGFESVTLVHWALRHNQEGVKPYRALRAGCILYGKRSYVP